MTDEQIRDCKIAQLLTTAGLITTSELAGVKQVSQRLQLPISRILLMLGCLNERHLEAALEAQSLVENSALSVEDAIHALILVTQTEETVTLTEALQRLDHAPQFSKTTDRLCQLLTNSKIVTSDQLNRALKTSIETGTSLSKTLVVQGAVSPTLLPAILRLMDRIHTGKISEETAIKELDTAYIMWLKAEKSLEAEVLAGQDKVPVASMTASMSKHANEPKHDYRNGYFPNQSSLVGIANCLLKKALRCCTLK